MFKAPCGKELLQSYAGQYVHRIVVRHSTGFPMVFQLAMRFKARFTVFYVFCFVLFCFFPFPLASDATRIFEETKHSVEAREMMQAFFVGIFVEVREYPVLLCHIISRKQSPSRLTF